MKINLPVHKTKIVCTIGPSSNSARILSKLIKAGMNIARLNLSHGTYDEHKKTLKLIRTVAKKLNRIVSVMVDLPGPKIRIGILKNGVMVLKKNDIIILSTQAAEANKSVIPVEYRNLPNMVSANDIIYLNDGFIQLKVRNIRNKQITCRVLIGGTLTSRKGLNIPGVKLGISAVTDNDLKIVDTFLKEEVDIFCVSFVERKEDILKVKRFIKNKGRQADVIAKIERAGALKNIDGVLDAADGIMVARGDLGVEIPIQEIPVVQKMLIHKANMQNKVTITATQMLLSMTEHIRPTRAEVTDVANAILDGTDAVMLSEETAVGGYPVETVKMMTDIAAITERKRNEFGCRPSVGALKEKNRYNKNMTEDIMSFDVKSIIDNMGIKLVITHTSTGNIVRGISRFKPDCWIFTVTNNKRNLYFLNLSYGVYPLLTPYNAANGELEMIRYLHKYGLIKKGDRILQISGSTDKKEDYISSLNIITI